MAVDKNGWMVLGIGAALIVAYELLSRMRASGGASSDQLYGAPYSTPADPNVLALQQSQTESTAQTIQKLIEAQSAVQIEQIQAGAQTALAEAQAAAYQALAQTQGATALAQTQANASSELARERAAQSGATTRAAIGAGTSVVGTI